MPTVIYVERKRIKDGYGTFVPSLRFAAHGASQEQADASLQECVRAFLRPFQRSGTLQKEMRALGLGYDGEQLEIVLE